ncbi:vestitone reductase-like isoform X2 [Papaver somniferum]|uniref:vestitone reductase-like isoform X2 n=1 Tax=Papaver somniferum TaxID=3469 RepID=UPI000E6FC21D|nr:vestitone reductase-like isoform X2 [Papaver somniferum]
MINSYKTIGNAGEAYNILVGLLVNPQHRIIILLIKKWKLRFADVQRTCSLLVAKKNIMADLGNYTVCVTGGAGFIGSSIVKKLLDKGHNVRTTLRNLSDENKVGLLKKLEGAETRLELFQADIYKPDEFDVVIKGCHFVFHVATPLLHSTENSHQYKNTTEAAIEGAKSIGESCIQSGTVRRLIYTASVVSASPLKEDGSGYKDVIDESCWTPLGHRFPYANDFVEAYIDSKSLSEKEILKFGDKNVNGGVEFEAVSLTCGLVGGDTILSYLPDSTVVGKVPIVHIEDIVDAHVFCMEQASVNGRYLCANGYVTVNEIREYFRQYHPDLTIAREQESEGDEKLERKIHWGSTKLNDLGFVYKCNVKRTLDDSVKCAQRFGDIN